MKVIMLLNLLHVVSSILVQDKNDKRQNTQGASFYTEYNEKVPHEMTATNPDELPKYTFSPSQLPSSAPSITPTSNPSGSPT
eukprot:5306061-Ditylum_brightwellii.AAC.1